jgi:CTP synthase (UTP-ammonia lyase)
MPAISVVRVALVGDHDATITAHRAIPRALELAAHACAVDVDHAWLPTDAITDDAVLDGFDAVWCVPGSPYRSMEGALRAIRVARESRRPFLGTCGGFQHALVEYARSVLGWRDAGHAEVDPSSPRAIVTPLACPLVEVTEPIFLRAGSHLAAAYGTLEIREGYHCRFGLDPAMRTTLLDRGALRATAESAEGEVRAVELATHPFYVAMLFQPERAAFAGEVPPIVKALVAAAVKHNTHPSTPRSQV